MQAGFSSESSFKTRRKKFHVPTGSRYSSRRLFLSFFSLPLSLAGVPVSLSSSSFSFACLSFLPPPPADLLSFLLALACLLISSAAFNSKLLW